MTLLQESWNQFKLNRPKVDLTKCKRGQKLLTNKGTIIEYIENNGNNPFPHCIKYPNGGIGSRTNEGWTYLNSPLPMDEDVVYIFPLRSKPKSSIVKN
jgi:hypothetical protein